MRERESNITLSKGEKYIIEQGLYVSFPINLMMLLTQSERDVLNLIRHFNNIGCNIISYSMFRLHTGLTDKTVKKAIENLSKMNIIIIGATCKKGTHYKVNYNVLANIIYEMNKEMNPVKRLRIGDKYRGEELQMNTSLIKTFEQTEFDTTL